MEKQQAWCSDCADYQRWCATCGRRAVQPTETPTVKVFVIGDKQVTLTQKMWNHWLTSSHIIEQCSICRTVKACVIAARRAA